MSFDAGSAKATLGLDFSEYAQGMLQATSIASLFPAAVTNFLASPLLGVIGIAKDLANALSGAFNAALAEADKLNDMATNAGVAVEVLSGLGLVAGQAGSGVEAVADAFKLLGKNAAEALQGNETVAADFARLGVRLKDEAGNIRPLEEVIFDVADGLAKLPDAGSRSDSAMALLGRSGTDLLATMTQGSAALREQIRQFEEYGAVVTRSAADSADAWGDTVGEIDIAMRGLRNTFAEPLRDALLPHLEETLAWVRDNQPEVRQAIADVIDGIKGIAAVARDLLPVLREVAGLVVDATDFYGITDPNRRFGNPYGGSGNPDLLKGMTQSSASTAPGADYLAAVAQGQLTAAERLVQAGTSTGDLTWGDRRTREAQEIAAGLRPQIDAYRGVVGQLGASGGASLMPPEQFEELRRKIESFGNAIQAAQERLSFLSKESADTAGGKSQMSDAMRDGLEAFRKEMDALRTLVPVRDLASEVASPDTGPRASAEDDDEYIPRSGDPPPNRTGGGSRLTDDGGTGLAALPQFNVQLTGATRGLDDFRDTMQDSLAGLTADMDAFRNDVLTPIATGAAPGGAPAGGATGGTNITANVTVPFDLNESTTQLAGKMLPALQANVATALQQQQDGLLAAQMAGVFGVTS